MDDRAYERRGEGAWMWMVLVLAVLGLLAGMVWPALHMQTRSCCRPNCGNNARQIVLAMLAYANDNDQKWPAFLPVGLAGARLDPWSARVVASRSMERLAIETGGDLTNKIFACPSRPGIRPTISPEPTRDDGQWGASATSAVGYAYDWATPAGGLTQRVVVADRDPRNHARVAMAVFADGHISALRTNPVAPAGQQTVGSDGAQVGFEAGNRDAGGEDIYSALGDEGDPLAIGAGSVTRAWVK